MKRIALLLPILFAISLMTQGTVTGAEDFYKGKTIRLVVGNSTGGAMDDWGRFVALYLGKHIPGNPDVVVQNMPGAGAIIAANYIYNVAKPDGLTLGVVNPANYIDQLLASKEVKFDWPKFSWIGSPERVDQVLFMRTDVAYKTIDELRAAKDPPRCAALARAGLGYLLPRLLEEGLGVKLNMVLGYGGGGDMNLAIEKGEVQCRGLTAAPFFGREPFISWRKKHFVNVLLYGGLKRDPRTPDTPTIYEIFDKENTPEETRRVADVILRGGDFGRPWVMPPETPKDLVSLMRAAYAKAMKDTALLDEAKKAKFEVEFVSGEELQKLAEKMIDQPPGVVARVKKLLGQS